MIGNFEHGIDHVGRCAVAPLLVIGGPVTNSDFEIRDLSSIQGVVVSERGLPEAISWADLNVRLLGERLRNLRYLYVDFSGKVNLNDIGQQMNMTYIELDCPKMLPLNQVLFPKLVETEVRVPDEALRTLLVPGIEKLTVIRPRFQDLSLFSKNRTLRSLDIHLARNLTSLAGLSDASSLEWLGLHDCPLFDHTGLVNEIPGPTELMLAGCKRLGDLSGLELFSKLRKLSLLGAGPHVTIPDALLTANVELEIRGRRIKTAVDK